MSPTYVRELNLDERRILEDWIRHPPTRDHYLRARITLLSSDGYGVPDIAKRIGRHESRVRMWIRQFNKFGLEGLQSSKPKGAALRCSEQVQQRILDLVLTHPTDLGLQFSRWTADRLRQQLIQENLVSDISNRTIRRVLEKASAGAAV
jgi:transposase